MAEKRKAKTTRKSMVQAEKTGKKRNSKAKTPAEKTAARKTRKAEIKGIMLVALGVFLVVVTFFTDLTGMVGHYFKEIIMGLFGGPAMIFFVFVIWTGVNLFLEKKNEKATYKMWLLLVFMIVSSVLWAAIFDGGEWTQSSFIEQIKSFYSFGTSGAGGGVMGGLICAGLVKLIGVVGTIILSVAVLLILFVILTEVSIERMLRKIGSYIKKNRDNISSDLDEEIDMGIDVDHRSKKEKRNKKSLDEAEKAAIKDEVQDDEQPQRNPNSDYFDIYFKEGEIESLARGEEVYPSGSKRFKFEEDDLADDEVSGVLEEVLEVHRRKIGEKDGAQKAVDITDVSGGVLTPFPDKNGRIPTNDDDFEPPTQAQIEDQVDPFTQEAIDAGVPLDRVIETGKRLNQQEVQQATDSVGALARESIEATRILNYKLPSVSLLAKPRPKTKSRSEVKRELEDKANRLLDTLASFKVDAKILNITQGPSVTRFELQPGFGIKVSKITKLAYDIALSLAASGVRIEAPIPGKSAIGIEIPNESPSPVPIREVIDTDKFREFKSKTAFALGKDIAGNCVIADIAQFPHVLIAGATGSGKSVCINSLITSILYKAKPNEVKMIMVDPKMVELGVYNGIPHLLIPVVTDPKHAAGALNWAVAEMKNRYQLMKDNKVRNLQGFNELMEENETPEKKLPEIVIIIDELADLMLAAKNEVEDAINSLAALARAAGMYLVIATQRPSVDVITGVIKANVPSRISFAVSSQVDSRTILDSMGAEKLLGKGDMLYAPRGAVKPIRIQGNFLSDEEIEDVIAFVKKQYEAEYDESILEHIEREQEAAFDDGNDDDDHTRSGDRDSLFFKAAELVFESGQASVAMLQRKYKVGYQRAARIIDQLEESRIIGPYEGTKPRQVLITRAELNELMMNNLD
ncbi:MAG: DNA translocase FtsK [Clostridia bacterium]|nr:DNA translocase FtsK [Clostridia bacterium]